MLVAIFRKAKHPSESNSIPSPTRDTRFCWMQSVVRCTHYVAGASEQHYINKADDPTVKFIERDEISDSGKAYTEL